MNAGKLALKAHRQRRLRGDHPAGMVAPLRTAAEDEQTRSNHRADPFADKVLPNRVRLALFNLAFDKSLEAAPCRPENDSTRRPPKTTRWRIERS